MDNGVIDALYRGFLKEAAGGGAALLKFLKGQAGAVGANAGAGAGIGGLIGGAAGALKAREEDRSMLGGAFQGATRGAGVGAAAGAGLGLAGGGAARSLASKMIQQENSLGSAARFGQRQVHSLTGYADKDALRAMRGGAYDAQKRLVQNTKALNAPHTAKQVSKLPGQRKAVAQAQRGLEAAEKAEAAGLTSVPGVLKGLAGKSTLKGKNLSPLQAAKTMVGEQWHGSGVGGKALTLGIPAASLAGAVQEPPEGGPGRAENIGRALGAGLAYATPMGLVGQSVLASGLGGAAGVVGAGIDTRAKRRKHGVLMSSSTHPNPEQAPSENVERVYSNSAAGVPPEGTGL